jgi:hypothetical protein
MMCGGEYFTISIAASKSAKKAAYLAAFLCGEKYVY